MSPTEQTNNSSGATTANAEAAYQAYRATEQAAYTGYLQSINTALATFHQVNLQADLLLTGILVQASELADQNANALEAAANQEINAMKAIFDAAYDAAFQQLETDWAASNGNQALMEAAIETYNAAIDVAFDQLESSRQGMQATAESQKDAINSALAVAADTALSSWTSTMDSALQVLLNAEEQAWQVYLTAEEAAWNNYLNALNNENGDDSEAGTDTEPGEETLPDLTNNDTLFPTPIDPNVPGRLIYPSVAILLPQESTPDSPPNPPAPPLLPGGESLLPPQTPPPQIPIPLENPLFPLPPGQNERVQRTRQTNEIGKYHDALFPKIKVDGTKFKAKFEGENPVTGNVDIDKFKIVSQMLQVDWTTPNRSNFILQIGPYFEFNSNFSKFEYGITFTARWYIW